MKRTIFTVVILFAFFAFIVPALTAQSYTANLGAFNLQFIDNFQGGGDYQGIVNARNLMQGHRIQPGETWTLRIKFKLSRDMEQDMTVALIDNTERARPNAWWSELSDDYYGVQGDTVMKAGVEYSATITLKTIAQSSGTAGAANALVFSTKGDGTPGRANSGVLKPFTMSFTEFILTRE